VPSRTNITGLSYKIKAEKIMKCPRCGTEISVYRNPVPTVDIIIETGPGIVLIRRKNPPFGWALPGGFVDYGESFEAAARREAKEETGLDVERIRQFHTYSDPDRDPRQHTASTVFIARAEGMPRAGDDAADVRIFTRDNLPPLVFDHGTILEDYFQHRY
jgi:ADP-ribose pyrophosphatase YjhB (NUDIX family)